MLDILRNYEWHDSYSRADEACLTMASDNNNLKATLLLLLLLLYLKWLFEKIIHAFIMLSCCAYLSVTVLPDSDKRQK